MQRWRQSVPSGGGRHALSSPDTVWVEVARGLHRYDRIQATLGMRDPAPLARPTRRTYCLDEATVFAHNCRSKGSTCTIPDTRLR